MNKVIDLERKKEGRKERKEGRKSVGFHSYLPQSTLGVVDSDLKPGLHIHQNHPDISVLRYKTPS